MNRTKEVDFKEVHLHISSFSDNEEFEALCYDLGLERKEETMVTLTITKIELRD